MLIYSSIIQKKFFQKILKSKNSKISKFYQIKTKLEIKQARIFVYFTNFNRYERKEEFKNNQGLNDKNTRDNILKFN